MDHQQFILDNLKRILDVTDKSKAAELLKLVDEAGSTENGIEQDLQVVACGRIAVEI